MRPSFMINQDIYTADVSMTISGVVEISIYRNDEVPSIAYAEIGLTDETTARAFARHLLAQIELLDAMTGFGISGLE